ncbi:SH3 domain-containing protein [bacterium]|nr:SH3 domain-containing protein [bacterium]
MSLPTSEPLPNDIHDLPPARQRQLRRQPRRASPAEKEILLDSLLDLTRPSFDFFLFAVLGALVAGAAFYFNEPAALILSLVLFPFNAPLAQLALTPASRRIGRAFPALVSLLIALAAAFGGGALAGWLSNAVALTRLPLTHFTAPYWPDLALTAGGAFFVSLILVRQDRLPRLTGALLSYEILLPLALAGYGMLTGLEAFWPGALLVGLLHLGLALIVATLSVILIGFTPRGALGWLLALIPVVLTAAVLTATLFYNQSFPIFSAPSTTPTPKTVLMTQTPSPEGVAPSNTPTQAAATATLAQTPSQTATPENTLTASPTPTQTATIAYGLVEAPQGALVRDEPSFDGMVVNYLYDGNQVILLREVMDGNTIWHEIQMEDETTGWILGTLINTPQPTPSPTAE